MKKPSPHEDLSAPAHLRGEGMQIEAVRAAKRNGAGSGARSLGAAPVRSLRAVGDFKAAFDADAGKVRLVVFFSPT